MPILGRRWALLMSLVVLLGCSRGLSRFEAPEIRPDSAAAQAIELYDANRDGALSKDELAKCPGMLAKITLYDRNGSGSVEQEEIAQRLKKLLKHGIGGTGLNAMVSFNGRPLRGATVVLEPEPYLGDKVQMAQGITDGAGSADLGISPEYVPEHLRRIKSVHYGTFKVRITHPTIPLPAQYNTQTELGYETEAGNPYVHFALKSK